MSSNKEWWLDHFVPVELTDQELQDCWMAPSGEGEFAFRWEDKPHRLVYMLLGHIKHMRMEGKK